MAPNIKPYDESEQDDPKSDFHHEEAYLRAKKKVEKLVGFYWHLAVYIIVNLFLIAIIGFNSNKGFWHFSTFSTAFFWGIGLFFHAMGVFGPNWLFGKNWEERKIKEYMDKDRNEWE